MFINFEPYHYPTKETCVRFPTAPSLFSYWHTVVIQLLGGPKETVSEVIVRLNDFARSCPRLCFSCTLHILLRPCRHVSALEAMY